MGVTAEASRKSAHTSLALFALAMGGFTIGTTEFGAMGLVPYFSQSLNINAQQAGYIISAYALGVVLGGPVLAVLVARLPRRNVLVGLMLVYALANGLTGLAPNFYWMVALRFIAGLPHGAYFGVAVVVAAELVPLERRAQAMARVSLGLTVATILGVPLASFIGQAVGWRWPFALVAALACATSCMVMRTVPAMRVTLHDGASPLDELEVLARPQVWLTLGIGAIGFGGMFAVYTYAASALLLVTKAPAVMVPFMLGIFGCGLTLGNLMSAWFADRALMPTIAVVLIWMAAALAIYPFMLHFVWSILLAVLLIGSGGGGLGVPLQTRLMQVAEGGQTLAAAMNNSALNIANALGPWLAGIALAAGGGWGASGWVGCGLAISGLLLWVIAVLDIKRPTGSRAVETA